MARKEKNNVDYFPHSVKNGKAMAYLENKYGNDGYAVWFKVLEQLGNAENHYLDIRNESELMLLSSYCRVSEDMFLKIMNDLVKLSGHFDAELYAQKIIYNEEFVSSIKDAYRQRSSELITKDRLVDILAQTGRIGGPTRPQEIPAQAIEEMPAAPQVAVRTKSSTPAASADSVLSWKNIHRCEYADMSDWIRGNYTELEFNAFVAFNKWIDEECPSVRDRTSKQIEIKNFAKLFRKLGGNKAAADALKDAMLRLAGGTITPDHDVYARLQMYLNSSFTKK